MPSLSFVGHGYILRASLFVMILSLTATLRAQDSPDTELQDVSVPSAESLIALIPRLSTESENGTQLPFSAEAEMPTFGLGLVKFRVAWSPDHYSTAVLSSRDDSLIAAFNDNSGILIDPQQKQILRVSNAKFSLNVGVREPQVRFDYAIGSQLKIDLDAASFLRASVDRTVVALEDSRYELQAQSPSGSTQVIARFDTSSSQKLESLEIYSVAEDKKLLVLRISEIRVGELSSTSVCDIPDDSQFPSDFKVIHLDPSESVIASLQGVKSLLRCVAQRVAIDRPDLREDQLLSLTLGADFNPEEIDRATREGLRSVSQACHITVREQVAAEPSETR